MAALRVIIVDDHAIVRGGVRSLLESCPDIEVVGEASNGTEAVEMALELRPDLVLMDIAMPGMSGIEATRRIKEKLPHIHVLVLTMHDDDEFFFPLLRAGASGYILKDAEPQELLYAVATVGEEGQPFLSPKVAKSLMEGYVAVAADIESSRSEALTPREKQVLQLAAAGHTNREIAQALVLSTRTVEKHRQAMIRKLNLTSRDDLVRYAIRTGLANPRDDTQP